MLLSSMLHSCTCRTAISFNLKELFCLKCLVSSNCIDQTAALTSSPGGGGGELFVLQYCVAILLCTNQMLL